MTFAIFDENFYLNSYPDVKAAVNAKTISSGFAHFQQYGLAEGRISVSPFYNEDLYLRKYPDVAAAVKSGSLKSGLQHYIQYGEAEGRSPGAFSEQAYRELYPDVDAAIRAGGLSSGLQHYIQSGIKEGRVAFFFGTEGNDVVAGAGGGAKLVAGISLDSLLNGQPTAGVGQTDTLVGTAGTDAFALGFPSVPDFTATSQLLYVGNGSADFARIQNFERFNDAIILSGTPANYKFQNVNGSLNISTTTGDLVGVVEGVPSLVPVSSTTAGVPITGSGPFFYLA